MNPAFIASRSRAFVNQKQHGFSFFKFFSTPLINSCRASPLLSTKLAVWRQELNSSVVPLSFQTIPFLRQVLDNNAVFRSISEIREEFLDTAVLNSSTMKKRRMKMNKHKLKKRRKGLRMNTKLSRN